MAPLGLFCDKPYVSPRLCRDIVRSVQLAAVMWRPGGLSALRFGLSRIPRILPASSPKDFRYPSCARSFTMGFTAYTAYSLWMSIGVNECASIG